MYVVSLANIGTNSSNVIICIIANTDINDTLIDHHISQPTKLEHYLSKGH